MGRRLPLVDAAADAAATDVTVTSAVARAREGDEQAMRWLYVRYAAAVRRCVHGLLRDADAADDVTQTTFLKLLTSLDLYEVRDATFEAWLLRVARNAAFDELRSRRGFATYDDGRASERETADDQLLEALQHVPGPERRVLVLRHFVGLTTREAAQELAVTERVVRDLECRGRDLLRPLLGRPTPSRLHVPASLTPERAAGLPLPTRRVARVVG